MFKKTQPVAKTVNLVNHGSTLSGTFAPFLRSPTYLYSKVQKAPKTGDWGSNTGLRRKNQILIEAWSDMFKPCLLCKLFSNWLFQDVPTFSNTVQQNLQFPRSPPMENLHICCLRQLKKLKFLSVWQGHLP